MATPNRKENSPTRSPSRDGRASSNQHRGERSRSRRSKVFDGLPSTSSLSKQLLELGIPGADEEAIRTLANFLESQGLTMLWQVQGVPDLVVDKWFPLEDNLLSNLLLKQVREVAKKHAQNPDGNTSSAITKLSMRRRRRLNVSIPKLRGTTRQARKDSATGLDRVVQRQWTRTTQWMYHRP